MLFNLRINNILLKRRVVLCFYEKYCMNKEKDDVTDDCIFYIVCLKPRESQLYKQWTEVDSGGFPGGSVPTFVGKMWFVGNH